MRNASLSPTTGRVSLVVRILLLSLIFTTPIASPPPAAGRSPWGDRVHPFPSVWDRDAGTWRTWVLISGAQMRLAPPTNWRS
jgi:hypothetical protein